jgi:hypothetical protein
MVIARNGAPRTCTGLGMFGSWDIVFLPLLTGVGVFALVGLIWNVFEGLNEEAKNDRNGRP